MHAEEFFIALRGGSIKKKRGDSQIRSMPRAGRNLLVRGYQHGSLNHNLRGPRHSLNVDEGAISAREGGRDSLNEGKGDRQLGLPTGGESTNIGSKRAGKSDGEK